MRYSWAAVAMCCGLLWMELDACAQPTKNSEKIPPVSEIKRLIQSDDPREMAWGAHYAEIKQSAATNDALLAAADGWQPFDLSGRPYVRLTPEQLDQQDGMAAVLDALIRLHVNLSAEVLSRLAPEFPNYVAVLMTRLPTSQVRELSFDFFREMPERGYSLQYVSAALLANSPPAGFAAELMAGTVVSADISIVAPGAPGIGRGMSLRDCMAGWGEREDWPKFGNYQFSREKGDGGTLLFSEPQPVYMRRVESTNDPGFSCGGLTLDREDRRKFLAYMLKIKPEEIGWKTLIYETIVYRSPEQVDLEVRKMIAREQEKFRATEKQLMEAGLMEESEAQSSMPMLRLHWWLNFEGENQPEIPRPTVLPDRVEWSENSWD